MLSLRNRLLQKSAFLRHNRCIELGKRYTALHFNARFKQLSPGVSLITAGYHRIPQDPLILAFSMEFTILLHGIGII